MLLRRWGLPLLLFGGLAAGLGAREWETPPAEPAAFRADELGLRFSGPKGWYVYQRNGAKVVDGVWDFRFKRKSMDGWLLDKYESYRLVTFYRETVPTPKPNMFLSVWYVKLMRNDDWKAAFEEIYIDWHRSVLDFKLLAGPVKDRIGGREAETLAFDGSKTLPFAGTTQAVRIQESAVPLGGGFLMIDGGGWGIDWKDFKPILRDFRKSIVITKPGNEGEDD